MMETPMDDRSVNNHGSETISVGYEHPYGADNYSENYGSQNFHMDRSAGPLRLSVDDSVIETYRDGSEVYPTLKRVSSYSNISRKSMDDGIFSDPRMQRLQQAEANIRREMFKECTFQPQIRGLPAAYGPLKETGTPFVARMEKWKKEREHQVRTKKDISDKATLEQCSFRPKINKYSERAAKEKIPIMSEESAHERLYKISHDQIEQRAKLLEEEALREEETLMSQCTFQPQLVTKRNPLFQQVKAKFAMDTPLKKEEITQRVTAAVNKDCTFTPKVNKVKSNMSSAKLYLRTNVVDRLSCPLAHSNGTPTARSVDDSMTRTFDDSFVAGQGNNVIDAATFIGSLQANSMAALPPPPPPPPATQRATSPHPTGAGASASTHFSHINKASVAAPPPKPPMTKEEARERQEKFDMFYARQQQLVSRRQQSLQNLEKHITPAFSPQVTTVAKRMTERGDFLKRVENDVQRRMSKEQRQEIEAVSQHSFRPEINKKAEAMRARTVFEMSRGDALRKEANNRMLKLKVDQEQLAEVTLQPAITAKAKEIGKSYIKMASGDNSQQYMDWLKEKERRLEEKRKLEKERREEMELTGCTFMPKTTECPAYIKRIKDSMDLVKAARTADSVFNSQVPKPEWR